MESELKFKEIPLVYLVYGEGLSSVFTSQVIRPMYHRYLRGFNVHIGVFAPLGQLFRPQVRNRWYSLRLGIPEEIRDRLTVLPTAPTRLRWAWDDAFTLRYWLSRKFGSERRFLLQCRGSYMTSVALKVRHRFPKARIIFDCRGDEVAEFIGKMGVGEDQVRYVPSIRRKYDRLLRLERSAVCDSDAVCCISSIMAKQLSARYCVALKKFHILPCCTDVHLFPWQPACRVKMRNELRLANCFVVSYCGSLEFYQLPDQVIRVFRIIRAIDRTAHLLVITTQPERFSSMLGAAGIEADQATVVCLPPTEVPKYLVASDLGLLLRRQDAVNRVAAPVKFAEYLASGTPVVITDGLGDYSQAAVEHGLGVLVDIEWPDSLVAEKLGQFLSFYAENKQEVRSTCRRFAEQYLSWESQTSKMIEIFDQLASW